MTLNKLEAEVQRQADRRVGELLPRLLPLLTTPLVCVHCAGLLDRYARAKIALTRARRQYHYSPHLTRAVSEAQARAETARTLYHTHPCPCRS